MARTPIALVAALVLILLAAPPVVEAQQAGKIPRLGWLINNTPTGSRDDQLFRQALPNQLRELGYVEGHNLLIERRYAEGRMERHRAFIDEFVRLKVDVIFAVGDQVIEMAKDATSDRNGRVRCSRSRPNCQPLSSRREHHRHDLHHE